MRRKLVVTTIAGLLTAFAAVGGSAGAAPAPERPADERAIVFNGQGNNLDAYTATPPFTHQTVIRTQVDDPNGLDINAQICFFPQDRGKRTRRFIAGEDTGQPNPPQGWGIFALQGDRVGSLSATEVAKLTPTYQGSADNAENYGCGFLHDGRILTTDVGNQASGSGDGQLIVWFPPFNTGVGGHGQVRYCKVDIGLATAGSIYVDRRDRVYVASARAPTAGIWRYAGPFPTSDTAAGGCETHDDTGAPLTNSVARDLFIPAELPLATPNAIARSPRGGFYVSSVFNGVIAEFDRRGRYRRTILEPPAGETLGAQPYPTGTPLGLGVSRAGTIFYADIGIVVSSRGIGPGNRTGSVRRIRFVGGRPQPPETMASGLAFPHNIGVLETRR